VWSFGIFCTELTDRKPPHFDEANQRALYNKILEKPYEELDKTYGDWS
jgi:hypothetical protein